MRPFRHIPALALSIALCCAAQQEVSAFRAGSLVLAGNWDGQSIDSVEFVNDLVGAMPFYNAGYFGAATIIGNIEAGHVWGGHEVFDRTGLSLPSSPSLFVNADLDPAVAPHLGETDYHATMVGHVLAGTGHVGEGSLSFLGMGMAPFAELWSGAVATEFDSENIGSFSVTGESLRVPYESFFTGAPGSKPDVINSSWGFSGDPAGTGSYVRRTDALAAQNPEVAFVVSAGNSGPAAGAVSGFAAGYNAIVVGSLGGASESPPYLQPSDFSSPGPADFFNPATLEVETGVRATVHIAAPGEKMALAYYPGATGALREIVEPEDPLPDGLYFTFNQQGTSFSAPVVAGGIALLKDVAHGGLYIQDQPEALDSRVLRSVIMAGAVVTEGWDNAQNLVDGVVTTTQSLDLKTGAGRLDLTRSVETYLFGTTGVEGGSGGWITYTGWDLATVELESHNDYFFDLVFPGHVELTVSLNWFVNRVYDPESGVGSESSFANLDLQIWSVVDGLFDTLVGQSISLYNNSEFLRLSLHQPGQYGLRVAFPEVVYDLAADPLDFLVSEEYGLAWHAVAFVIPEPSATRLLLVVTVVFLFANRLRRNAAR